MVLTNYGKRVHAPLRGVLIVYSKERLSSRQARSQDVKFGGAKLFLEGQLSTKTENVNTNTKKIGITLCKSMSELSAK